MKQDILLYLFGEHSASAESIARDLGQPRGEVQRTLIQMDDAGEVLMRNGIYRLSEVSVSRMRKRFDDFAM